MKNFKKLASQATVVSLSLGLVSGALPVNGVVQASPSDSTVTDATYRSSEAFNRTTVTSFVIEGVKEVDSSAEVSVDASVTANTYKAEVDASVTANTYKAEIGATVTANTYEAEVGATVTANTYEAESVVAAQPTNQTVTSNTYAASSGMDSVSSVTYSTPNTVTNLSVVDVTYKRASIAWTPVSNADYYKVELNTGEVYTTTSPNYEFIGLTPDTSYVYTVYSVNENGEDPGHVAAFSTPAIVLDQPTGVKLDSINGDSISLQWDAVENAKWYEVVRNDSEVVYRGNANSAKDYALSTDTTYMYQVFAHTEGGKSKASDAFAVTNIKDVKQATEQVTVSDATYTHEKTGFSFSLVDGADEYRVKRGLAYEWVFKKNPDGSYTRYTKGLNGLKDATPVKTVDNKISFSEEEMSPNTDYQYSIRAVKTQPNGVEQIIGKGSVTVTTAEKDSKAESAKEPKVKSLITQIFERLFGSR